MSETVYPEDYRVGIKGVDHPFSALFRDDQYLMVGVLTSAPNGACGWLTFWVRLDEVVWADKNAAAKFGLACKESR